MGDTLFSISKYVLVDKHNLKYCEYNLLAEFIVFVVNYIALVRNIKITMLSVPLSSSHLLDNIFNFHNPSPPQNFTPFLSSLFYMHGTV